MKLTDLFEDRESTRDFEVTELGDELYEPFIITVSYWYERGGYSDHPYGEGVAREQHPDTWGISSVRVKTTAKHIDENGKVLKRFAPGHDAEKLPGWSKAVKSYYEELIGDELSA